MNKLLKNIGIVYPTGRLTVFSTHLVYGILKLQKTIIYGDGEQKHCFSFDLTKLAFLPEVVGETINIVLDEELATCSADKAWRIL
ncbi:MAG: hypothetical protein LBQ22_07480 [Bacteroidales bacterium]|jgi:hypothetical protein|nr:hypothetical protein [Bacteroidales bacterium]